MSKFLWSSRTIIVLTVLLVIGSAFMVYRHTVPTGVSRSALMIAVNSLDELEDRSTLIVEVTVSGKGRQDENDFPYTYTPVQVTKVYKGNVSPGEEIEVTEFYRYFRTPAGLYIETIEDYLPMEKGGKYLLFLYEESSGLVTIVNVYLGKFVWPAPGKASRSAENLEINNMASNYTDILDAVVAKYGRGN